MKTTEKHYKPIAVKTAEYSENIRTELNPNLKQSVCAFYVFEIGNRHSFNSLKNIKHFDNLVLNFSGLLFEEILEIVFICYDFSVFTLQM